MPPSAVECAEDHHACGATCVAQLPNDPAVGCTFGCAPCPVPSGAIATCTASGMCDFQCPAGLAKQGGACVAAVCAAYACGTITDDAGAAFDCGTCTRGECVSHQCAIAPDAYEGNEVLGEFNDADDPSVWIEDLSIAAGDEDWFRFHVTDGFDGGNPRVSVELANRATELGWLDSNHELTVWFRCDTANVGSTVACGEWFTESARNTLVDPALGIGCTVDGRFVAWGEIWPSCTGIADSGIVTFRVRKRTPPRGDTYDVRVRVR